MRRDDPSVEFLVADAEPGTDEELVQPEGFPRLRRMRLPLFAAAAVGLLVLVVATVIRGPSGSPSASRATVTVVPTPSPTAVLQLPSGRRTAMRAGVLPDGVRCPVGSSCAVLFRTPKPVVAAVHRALPKAKHLRTTTTTSHSDLPGSQLLAREITGRVGKAHLDVTITSSGRHDRLGWNASEDAVRTQVTATRHVGGRLVTVLLSAPPGYSIGIAAVRRLAADPRLPRLA